MSIRKKIDVDVVAANLVLCGPTSGSSVAPTYRSLVIGDLPTITYAKLQSVSATDKLLGRASSGAGVVEEITCTAFGRSLLDDANAAAALVTLGAQPLATNLTSFGALTNAAGYLYNNGSGTLSYATPTASVSSADDLTTATAVYPLWMSAAGANPVKISTTKISFVPSTGNLTLAGTVSATSFDAATLNLGTSTATSINLGTASTTQTVNIGTGSGTTTINLGSSGDTVNIAGTLAYVNTTNLQVTDKLVTLNKGGAPGSGSVSGLEVEENGAITSYLRTTGDRAGWEIKAPGATGVLTLSPGSSNAFVVLSTDSRLTDSRPASDVYAWAKSASKPTYTFSEIGSGTISATTGTFSGAISASSFSGAGTGLTGTAFNFTSGHTIVLNVSDTRAITTTPETQAEPGVLFNFKANGTEGLSDGGSYFGEMSLRPWGEATDWSGGKAHQLGFTDNGNIWQRFGSGTTWGSWYKLLDSHNFVAGTDYLAPNGSGAGLTGTAPSLSVNYATTAGSANLAPYAYNSTFLDLSGLDQSTWYPVTIQLPQYRRVRMRIMVALDSGTVPSWSTHSAGFSVLCDWTSNGHGWGTVAILREIHNYFYAHANISPVGGINQLGNGSIEYIYLRGGGKYKFESDYPVTPTLQTSSYTVNSETVAPTTTLFNDVFSSATCDVGFASVRATGQFIGSGAGLTGTAASLIVGKAQNAYIPNTNIAIGNSTGDGVTYVSGFYYSGGLIVPAQVVSTSNFKSTLTGSASILGNWTGVNYWGMGSNGAHSIRLGMVDANGAFQTDPGDISLNIDASIITGSAITAPTFKTSQIAMSNGNELNSIINDWLYLGYRTTAGVRFGNNKASVNCSDGSIIASSFTGSGAGLTGTASGLTAGYATNANYANSAGSAPANGGTSAAVTINYGNDSNSTYQMLWGSGNYVYGTSGIYCNPYTDIVYAADFSASSDRRLKTNIKPISSALDKVRAINGVTFKWNELSQVEDKETEQVGVLAQDVLEVLPQAVNQSGEYLSVSYGKLVPLLIEAIKELQEQVNELRSR